MVEPTEEIDGVDAIDSEVEFEQVRRKRRRSDEGRPIFVQQPSALDNGSDDDADESDDESEFSDEQINGELVAGLEDETVITRLAGEPRETYVARVIAHAEAAGIRVRSPSWMIGLKGANSDPPRADNAANPKTDKNQDPKRLPEPLDAKKLKTLRFFAKHIHTWIDLHGQKAEQVLRDFGWVFCKTCGVWVCYRGRQCKLSEHVACKEHIQKSDPTWIPRDVLDGTARRQKVQNRKARQLAKRQNQTARVEAVQQQIRANLGTWPVSTSQLRGPALIAFRRKRRVINWKARKPFGSIAKYVHAIQSEDDAKYIMQAILNRNMEGVAVKSTVVQDNKFLAEDVKAEIKQVVKGADGVLCVDTASSTINCAQGVQHFAAVLWLMTSMTPILLGLIPLAKDELVRLGLEDDSASESDADSDEEEVDESDDGYPAKRMAALLFNFLEQFDITKEQIVAYVGDNAPINPSTAKKLGTAFVGCTAHLMHHLVKATLENFPSVKRLLDDFHHLLFRGNSTKYSQILRKLGIAPGGLRLYHNRFGRYALVIKFLLEGNRLNGLANWLHPRRPDDDNDLDVLKKIRKMRGESTIQRLKRILTPARVKIWRVVLEIIIHLCEQPMNFIGENVSKVAPESELDRWVDVIRDEGRRAVFAQYMTNDTNPAFAEAFMQDLDAELALTRELEHRTEAVENAGQGGVNSRGNQRRPGIVQLVEAHRLRMQNLLVSYEQTCLRSHRCSSRYADRHGLCRQSTICRFERK